MVWEENNVKKVMVCRWIKDKKEVLWIEINCNEKMGRKN